MPYINIIEFNNSTQSILVLPWNIKALVESLYSIIFYAYGANFVEWLHWEYQYPIELNNQSYNSLVIVPRTQQAKLDLWLLMKNKSNKNEISFWSSYNLAKIPGKPWQNDKFFN